MNGPALPLMAAIGIPSAWQCFAAAVPILAVVLLRWVIHHSDRAVDRLFPSWEWEKRLGWLNARNERRTAMVLRWIGYFLYALLAVALYGIVWAAPALGRLDQWNDPDVLGAISLKLVALLVCLGIWLAYLGLELFPKLRRQYETEELEKFRAELASHETERDSSPDSRLKSLPEKPRTKMAARPGRLGPRR